MNAPNRLDDVASIVAPFLPFPSGDAHDPARLAVLLTNIIPGLNKIDGGRWGCLMKTDQGNKVPCDVLVWKDTNEVIDCLDRNGATWDNHGPNVDNPAWKWTAVANPEPAPSPSPVPLPPIPDAPTVTNEQILFAVQAVHAALDAHVKNLNASLAPVVVKILGMP